jgi:hypothetical protein
VSAEPTFDVWPTATMVPNDRRAKRSGPLASYHYGETFVRDSSHRANEGAIHLAPQIPEMSDRYIRSAQTEGETA